MTSADPTPAHADTGLHAALARELLEAARECRPVVPLSTRHPELTLDDAYDIQREIRAVELRSGARLVGRKIGATSEAIRQMFGIDHPDFGFLSDRMLLGDGARIDARKLIAPRVEGEIAFRLAHDLAGPDVTREDVLAATLCVHPILEVLDSRIRDWAIQLVDTVADNASCAVAVVGDACPVDDVDFVAERMALTVDGVVLEGTGEAVMGHPAEPVAWLARTLAPHGELLEAGSLVLAGAWVAAAVLVPGSHAQASFDSFGSVSLTVKP